MKKLLSLLSTSVLALSFNASAALITYEVSDADNNAGSPIGHGLYTFGKYGTGHAKYSIQSGSFFTIDTVSETATLIGTAKNRDGRTATFNLFFSDFAETNAYKREGGKVYNPAIHDIAGVLAAPGNGDIDFFETIAGSVIIDGYASGTRSFDIKTCIDCPNTTDPFGLQFGDGANAKNASDFGASAWVGVGPTYDKASHWDFNLKFKPVDVPEPGSMALIALGIAGLVATRRKMAA